MAWQRLHVGPLYGSKLLGVLAAALLITALFVTGHSQQLAGVPQASPASTTADQAPYSLDGGYRCPLARPVLVMADGRSYPAGHPTRPPRVPAPSPATRALRRQPPPGTALRRCPPASW